jgi:hypothetical protein
MIAKVIVWSSRRLGFRVGRGLPVYCPRCGIEFVVGEHVIFARYGKARKSRAYYHEACYEEMFV